MRMPALLSCALLFGYGLGCSDGTGGGGPAEMTFRLDSPHGDEAAFLVRISGALSGEPWAPGARSEPREVDAGVVLAVVAREPGMLKLVLPVEDKEDPPELQILQVVGPDNRLRSDLSGYSFRRGS